MANLEPEHMIELIGKPDEVEAWLRSASRVEKKIFRKHQVNPGHYQLWYRGQQANNDLVAAIKKHAAAQDAKPAPKKAE
jgi:hypothetical protein